MWPRDLQGKVAFASAGSLFRCLLFVFTMEYFPISVNCSLALIFRSWSSLLRYHGPWNLSPITFHANSPGESFEVGASARYFATLRQGFWGGIVRMFGKFGCLLSTRPNSFIWPYLNGSQCLFPCICNVTIDCTVSVYHYVIHRC
jgi:hypothetical protein